MLPLCCFALTLREHVLYLRSTSAILGGNLVSMRSTYGQVMDYHGDTMEILWKDHGRGKAGLVEAF